MKVWVIEQEGVTEEAFSSARKAIAAVNMHYNCVTQDDKQSARELKRKGFMKFTNDVNIIGLTVE